MYISLNTLTAPFSSPNTKSIRIPFVVLWIETIPATKAGQFGENVTVVAADSSS